MPDGGLLVGATGKRGMQDMRIVLVLSALLSLSACSTGFVGAYDKEAHYMAGAMVSHYVTQQTGSPLQGCAASFGLGILKEAIDSTGYGVVDRGDAMATGAGCSIRFEF